MPAAIELAQCPLVITERLGGCAEQRLRFRLFGNESGEVRGGLVRFQSPSGALEMMQSLLQSSFASGEVGKIPFDDRRRQCRPAALEGV